MKPYRISCYILAQKEILEQKVVSFLILTAVVLSTMMTTAVVQSAGMLTCRSAFDKDKDILSPVFPSNPRNLSASSDSAISIGSRR